MGNFWKRHCLLGSLFLIVIIITIGYYSLNYIFKISPTVNQYKTIKIENRKNIKNLDIKHRKMDYKINDSLIGDDSYKIFGRPLKEIYVPGYIDNDNNVDLICPQQGKFTKLLILTYSALNHKEARMTIRLTWGSYRIRKDVSHAFVLGDSHNETLNRAITEENNLYGDLVRGKFIDSYWNLTLKAISLLEWADQHCSQAKFILKTDDDVYVHIPILLEFLEQENVNEKVIYGNVAQGFKPIRLKFDKYHVSHAIYPASVFPRFVLGPVFVFSSRLVHDLYLETLKENYFKLDDVLLTGVVAGRLGIRRVKTKHLINFYSLSTNDIFSMWIKQHMPDTYQM